MPLILSGNVASALPTGYDVDNSCRFNDGDSAYMNFTSVSTVTNRLKFTISLWVKRSALGAKSMIGTVGGDDTNFGAIWFDSSDRLNCTEGSGGGELNFITNRVFRDISAWYNIILAIDTTQGTEGNRVKIYVNGTQETSFSTATYPSQNSNMHLNRNGKVQYIGRHTDSSNDYYFDGYMAEVCWIDGSQEAATSFGEFDEDSPTIWKPIDVSGLTFGNNGFYCDFADSGDLGDDESGNGNDWTENNLAATDQMTDTQTNNFCTLNSLDSYWESSTFSEGNLKIVTESTDYSYNTSTIGLTAGKWYCEVYIETTPHSSTKDSMIGIAGRMTEASQGYLGLYADTYGIYGGNGNIYNDGSASYGVSHTTGDIIGIYLDLDNNKLYFAKNGTIMNSGTGKSITAASATTAGAYFMVAADFYNGLSGTYRMNFGNPIYSLSSANTDANGYGSFEYDPSSGTFDGSSKDFYAICTKNLAEFGG